MNIIELGAIGELVGGVAVIASLLFVGIQVRSSTKEQKAVSMREATRETANVVQYLTGPAFAEIWLQGLRDYHGLDPADRVRFSSVLVHYFRMFEQLYHQVRGKDVEPGLWLGFERQLRDVAGYPGFEGWWEERGHWFSDPFRSFVESKMGADDPPRLLEGWDAEA